MIISQHLFMPLVAKELELGYYNSNGSRQSSGTAYLNYRTYPLMTYPCTPLFNVGQIFAYYPTVKLRTWTSTTASSQNQYSFSPEPANVFAIGNKVSLWTSSDYKDDYQVKVLFWKEPVSASRLQNITIIPQTEEDER